jgi:hypothetical protein
MTILESTQERLVVQSGSLFNQTTLTLDKNAGRARLDHSLLMWKRAPREFALRDIADVDLLTVRDAVSGADTHMPVLRTRAGDVVNVPASETEATQTAERLRAFLGLHA